MTQDWREIVPDSLGQSYVADAVWDRKVVDADDELDERQIAAEDPTWTPPPDPDRPQRTLGPTPGSRSAAP